MAACIFPKAGKCFFGGGGRVVLSTIAHSQFSQLYLQGAAAVWPLATSTVATCYYCYCQFLLTVEIATTNMSTLYLIVWKCYVVFVCREGIATMFLLFYCKHVLLWNI